MARCQLIFWNEYTVPLVLATKEWPGMIVTILPYSLPTALMGTNIRSPKSGVFNQWGNSPSGKKKERNRITDWYSEKSIFQQRVCHICGPSLVSPSPAPYMKPYSRCTGLTNFCRKGQTATSTRMFYSTLSLPSPTTRHYNSLAWLRFLLPKDT